VDVESDAKEMWEVFHREVVPLNQEVAADYVRVEIWADSGRIIVFPATSKTPRRIEKALCQVAFERLLTFYQQLATSDASDSVFSDQLDAKLQELTVSLGRGVSAAGPEVTGGLKVVFFNADSEPAIAEVPVSRGPTKA